MFRNELNLCLDAPQNMKNGLMIHLWSCHGNVNQLWSYSPDFAQMKHWNGKCLANPPGSLRVALADCDPSDPAQQWRFQDSKPLEMDHLQGKGKGGKGGKGGWQAKGKGNDKGKARGREKGDQDLARAASLLAAPRDVASPSLAHVASVQRHIPVMPSAVR